jgi:beta-carotene ketolase (CrtW type)
MFIFEKEKFSVSLIIAFLIILLWGGMLILCLTIDVNKSSIFVLGLMMIVQTFLNTGLFITAHDAMHGLVCPANLRLNHAIGVVAVTLYAFFSYSELRERHLLHHNFPGTSLDPDYYEGENSHFLSWYGQFMQRYLNWQQLFKLLLMVLLISYIGHISFFNLILCWWLPLILSSLQLFTFGTFFPHRHPKTSADQVSPIRSLNLSPFWSFLSCYHFSYHWEHHQYPYLAWWQLPSIRHH